MALYIGTSGWSYPKGGGAWDGVFYPDGMPDAEKLAYYARYFNAVELNSSFYRPPSPFAARAWVKKTPEDFRFTAKLWQKFTHPKMFEEATGKVAEISDDDFARFAEGIGPLAEAGKLGALLAQFPPSFKPTAGSAEYLADLVRRLQAEGYPLAVELRHREWTGDDEAARAVRRLFEDEGVAWVMIDEPKFRTSIRDVPLTSRLGYFRFHGRNYEQWWHHAQAEDRYNYLYAPEEQRELASEVKDVAQQAQNTFAFYNNHYRAKAVVNALQLKAALGDPIPGIPAGRLALEYPELTALPIAKSAD